MMSSLSPRPCDDDHHANKQREGEMARHRPRSPLGGLVYRPVGFDRPPDRITTITFSPFLLNKTISSHLVDQPLLSNQTKPTNSIEMSANTNVNNTSSTGGVVDHVKTL
jgi:hypothetical protein